MITIKNVSYFSPSEYADKFGIALSTVYYRIDVGIIPKEKIRKIMDKTFIRL